MTFAEKYRGDGRFDFCMPLPEGRPLRVLQLTDIQTIDLTAARNATRNRQIRGAYFKNGILGMEERAYTHIREVVKTAAPDLVLLTGDNIYGEFDDKGRMLAELVELMESLDIPWAATFGNHDNESRMGVDWQCKMLENAPHCLFKRGEVTGNANYSIALTQCDMPVFALVLLDSGGCHPVGNPGAPEEGLSPDNPCFQKLEHQNRIAPDQIKLYRDTVGELPNAVFLHIAPLALIQAMEERYGYRPGLDIKAEAPDEGRYVEHMRLSDFTDREGELFEALRAHNCRAVFAGHQHNNDIILRDFHGITLGFGLKTGFATYWRRGSTGGTLHQITADGSITHTHIRRI